MADALPTIDAVKFDACIFALEHVLAFSWELPIRFYAKYRTIHAQSSISK